MMQHGDRDAFKDISKVPDHVDTLNHTVNTASFLDNGA
jgi:hypothetical protein